MVSGTSMGSPGVVRCVAIVPDNPRRKDPEATGVGVAMRPMTPDETRAFLLEGTRTGKLAWVGRDGRPHVAPVWFTLDGDDVVFNTHIDTGKAKALRREGAACLVVDEESPPYGFVKIDATVSFDDDPARVRALATAVGGRYMGADRAEEYGARNGVAGELVVRLSPAKVTAVTDVSA